MDSQEQASRRVPPAARFAAPEYYFDLSEAVEALRREPHPPVRGHRQEALYRRGGTTVALFSFDEGAELADHVAQGLVLIQGLAGALQVRTQEGEYKITPGKMVALAPGVRHSVHARESSAMLLTISAQGKD